MTPQNGIILLQFLAMVIAIVFYLRNKEDVADLEETISNLHGDIQLLEIREMQLKDELKDVILENEFMYKC